MRSFRKSSHQFLGHLLCMGLLSAMPAQAVTVANLEDVPVTFVFQMPLGQAVDGGENVSWDLERLRVEAFPDGTPKVTFNGTDSCGQVINRWMVAAPFNINLFINNYCTGTHEDYSDVGDVHPGEDWNALTGQDSGLPIFAIGNGIVLYSGESNGWGHSLILLHRTALGEYVTSMYSHMLEASPLQVGAYVRRGEVVGKIGNSGGNWSPHLHFEVRKKALLNIGSDGSIAEAVPFWPRTSDITSSNFHHPSNFLRANRALPLVGDWDGDGRDTVSLIRNTLDSQAFALGTGTISFGAKGDLPVSGDWDGDGRDDGGVFRPREEGRDASTFYLDFNEDGVADRTVAFGFHPHYVPVIGDWDGDGLDDLGGFDPVDALFDLHLVSGAGTLQYTTVSFGTGSDIPIAGDWDGDGRDDIGVFRPGDPGAATNNFYFDEDLSGGAAEYTLGRFGLQGYGEQGDWPLIGDWDGDGDDNIGVFRPQSATSLRETGVPGPVFPEVDSVSPSSVVLNQPAIFTVSGSRLTIPLYFSLGDCPSPVELAGGTASQRQFRCTPGGSTGAKSGTVSNAVDGTLLKTFSVNATAPLPLVSGVSPLGATLGQSTEFTVTGSNLVAGLVFTLQDCTGTMEFSGGTSTSRRFRCTPGGSAGSKAGSIRTASGTTLRTFTVTVAAPLPLVNSVLPLTATLNQPTTFAVSGSNLPIDLAFWIQDCAGVTALGGTASQRQFRCTPSYSAGAKAGTVKTNSGGTVLRNFTITVSAPLPSVSSVSPLTATLNQPTTFAVSGSNLPIDLAFWVQDCAGVTALSGGTTSQRQFRCTPSYSTGAKAGTVKTNSGGTVLRNFTVTVSAPLPSVSSVSPLTATLNQTVTFTVAGANLPGGMGFWIQDCVGVTELSGGTSSRRQFRCTPRYTRGTKPGTIKTAPSGITLRSFSVTVR